MARRAGAREGAAAQGALPGKGRDSGTLEAGARPSADCRAAPPRGLGQGRRDEEMGGSATRAQAEAAAATHSARTPSSPLPPPPYCSRPGRRCASNLARTCRRRGGAGPAWGPERSERRQWGLRQTVTKTGGRMFPSDSSLWTSE